MKTWLLALGLGGILVGSIAALVWAWRRVDVEIPAIGWAALAAGAVLSILIGGGLMALSFYSARSGWDDQQRPPDQE